jgi:hypothetical protein
MGFWWIVIRKEISGLDWTKGRIILKFIIEKYDAVVWTGFM